MMDARSAHILIVDDNATNRMVAEALCEMFDCTSEQVVDGVEAVEAAKSGRFDLILMDIKMPRMDGVTATRAIRELPGRPASTPIVALTANADPGRRRHLHRRRHAGRGRKADQARAPGRGAVGPAGRR
jgi:CheY-like chemotaxis protein